MGSLEIAPSYRALPPILRDEPSQSRRLFCWERNEVLYDT
nr:MAG TPA: Sin3 family co-repressor [Caudoviricetes sp.]